MSEKLFLSLLILCGILSQGIIETFAEENITNSSDLLVRKKRLIDHTPEGDRPLDSRDVPYIVKIKKQNLRICAGIILSPAVVLTADVCVQEPISAYRIVSGAEHFSVVRYHDIRRKINRVPGHDDLKDLALLFLDELIDLAPPGVNRKIDLYVGPIPVDELATIAGWGPIRWRPHGLLAPDFLRSMEVPIISKARCGGWYRDHFAITNKNICTLDTSCRRRCSNGDGGAALILNNRLAGVNIFSGEFIGRCRPDIFINVNYGAYRPWILSHTLPNLQNQEPSSSRQNARLRFHQNEHASRNSQASTQ